MPPEPQPATPPRPPAPTRVLSGIQPTGRFHWGNYFGAIRQYIDLQPSQPMPGQPQPDHEAYYFIADLHALTTVREPDRLRSLVHDAAVDLVALGLDPDRATLFVQSDVPEVTELTWLLMTVTPMGLLERCHSFKDKVAKLGDGEIGSVNHGLFAYPVLMAADILAFDSNIVPVGRDQKQHLEVTRDIAGKFNQLYGQTFIIPEPRIREEGAAVPGLDGQKMSKSYGNTIEIFGEEKATRKKIMGIVMDSRTPAEPKPDADNNLAVQLLKLVAPIDLATDFENRLRAGGLGYGDLKKALFENYWQHFTAARAKRAELAANQDYVRQILREGAERARAVATKVLQRAKQASGLN